MPEISSVEWRDIPGYEGKYLICRDGRIFNIERRTEVKPYVHHTGYMCVNLLRMNGMRRLENVHRLLALTFIGPAPRSVHAHHKNENKMDNQVDNIEYKPRHKHLSDHNRQRSLLTGVCLSDEVQRIVDASERCLKPKDIAFEFSKKFPDSCSKSSVRSTLLCLAHSGRIQRVAHGWYARNGNSVYVVPIERKQYVPVAACISHEDKNAIDEMAQATGKTISEVVRHLIEKALDNN